MAGMLSHREDDDEVSPLPNLAVEFEPPVMGLDNPSSGREPKPGAPGLGCKIWMKYL